MAWGAMVSVAPRNPTMLSINTLPRIRMTTPIISAVKKPTLASIRASSVLPEPSAWLTGAPLPMPMVKEMAWMMPITENTTPTAPEAEVLIWLTK